MTDIRPRSAAALASLLLLAFSGVAQGRVVSYAPLTGRPATPALQKRTNRHALLVEQTGAAIGVVPGPVCYSCVWAAPARLVLHDSAGLEEPRDVTPGGADVGIDFAASREEAGLPPVLLASGLRGRRKGPRRDEGRHSRGAPREAGAGEAEADQRRRKVTPRIDRVPPGARPAEPGAAGGG